MPRAICAQCAQCHQPIFSGQRLRIIRETEDDANSAVAVTHCDCVNPDAAGYSPTGERFVAPSGQAYRLSSAEKH